MPALQNPENLLIFAAGNEGEPLDPDRTSCTIGSPAIGKNALAVGATSSGSTRVTFTDGYNAADIDTVASFSSYGPTMEGRIKPEVVAPGDYVRTVFSFYLIYGCVLLTVLNEFIFVSLQFSESRELP